MNRSSKTPLPDAWNNPPNLRSVPFNEILSVWDSLDGKGSYPDAIRALCLTDRYYLLVKVLNRHDVWHPWVYERCREVEANPDGYIDIWGREHYKSTIITFAGCIQEVLKNPGITIGIFSHTKHIAKGFLGQIQRELEGNAKLITLFPDVLYDNPTKESKSWSLDNGITVRRSSNPKEATIEAHGLVDGQPTSKHFQLLVYDDVVTRESVSTPEQVTKTTQAWELSDNLGVAGGRKWHVGTRYDFGDTYSEIIKRNAAILRQYPATHDGTIMGRPVLMTQSQWDKKVIDQGESTVACQLLCNPLAGTQRMFDVNDLEDYEVRPETLQVYIPIDPARSMKKGSANTAMPVIGIDYAGNKYLLDGYDHKMPLQERWQRMKELYETWTRAPGVQGVHVGYERYGAIADLDYFEERMRVEKCTFEIVELEWPRDGESSKTDRVQRLGPDFRSHRFYIPYPTNENRLTKAQHKMVESGYEYRISRPIKRKDESGNIYDLTERFKAQVGFFPFCQLKDLIDATSRIYDMNPIVPSHVDETELEPEYV